MGVGGIDPLPAFHLVQGNVCHIQQILLNIVLITIGSVLCALAVNGILIPKQFLNAGFTGLALMIHYLFPTRIMLMY